MQSPEPHVDCPACPECEARCGVPRRAAHWNHRARPEHTIVCPACGEGWIGTPAEVEQAERAQRAWEALEAECEPEPTKGLSHDDDSPF